MRKLVIDEHKSPAVQENLLSSEMTESYSIQRNVQSPTKPNSQDFTTVYWIVLVVSSLGDPRQLEKILLFEAMNVVRILQCANNQRAWRRNFIYCMKFHCHTAQAGSLSVCRIHHYCTRFRGLNSVPRS
jgi:hypothetical protein